MRGELRQTSLAEVVRRLYAERKSGVLHVSRRNIRRRLHFRNGVAIFADAGDDQLQDREQAEQLAYSLFTWTSGEFAFEEGAPNIADSLAFEGSPAAVILEGIRRIDEIEILDRLIGGRDSIFSRTGTSVLPLLEMKLLPAENAILTFARESEQFTAADLPLPCSDLQIVNALNALLGAGLLQIVSQKTAPPTVAPTPTPPPVPVAPPPRAPVAPAAPPAETTRSAPAPAPTPQVGPIMPSVANEMEQLFDALESKRSGLAPPQPTAPAPATLQPAPVPPAPPVAQPPPPPPPETLADAAVVPPEPVVEAAAPAPAPPAHRHRPAVEPSAHRPPLMKAVSGRKDTTVELPPTGRTRLIAGGSMALVGAVVALVWILSSGNEQASQSAPVVAADTTPPVEASPPEPPPPRPSREPDPVVAPKPEPEPSEDELLYRASSAFESGDFEQSQAELATLLELKPGLAAARELMARVERELAPEPEPPKPKQAPGPVVRKPPEPSPEPVPPAPPEPAPPTPPEPVQLTPSEPKPKPEPVQPPPRAPSQLFADARAALNRGELELSQARLDELKSLTASYPGAQRLEDDLADRFWERTLPLAYSSRHDHKFGGCSGVVTLTALGFGFRSSDHDWFWRYRELEVIDRKDSRHLRIETTDGQSSTFELRDPLTKNDWARYQSRYQRLRSR